MSKYEEQPDDGLTDEERAALLIVEEPEATTSEEQHVNEDEQQTETPAAQADADGQAAADPVAPAADAAPAPAAAAAEPEAAPEAQPAAAPEVKPQVSAPILVIAAPEDAPAKLADIATKKAELAQKFEDGEVTAAEMHKELDALNEQQFDIKLAVREYELAGKMEAQRLSAQWNADCNAFLTAHPEYNDQARGQLLDDTIKAIASIPANFNLTNAQALAKAHRMVMVELGEEVKPATPAPVKVVQHVVPKPEVPPNIGNLPAASMNDTNGGEFAALERLRTSGNLEAYEEAVDKLSDAAKARYLRA